MPSSPILIARTQPAVTLLLAVLLLSGVTAPAAAQDARITHFQTSSQMPDFQIWSYGAESAFDGDPLTSWVEYVDGYGIGEYLQIRLDRTVTVDAVAVMPGFFDPRYYHTNSRVKELRMHAFGQEYILSFDDVMEEQIVSLPEPVPLYTARFVIEDVFPGRDADTCIAEIAFFSQGRRLVLDPEAAWRLEQTARFQIPLYADTALPFREEFVLSDYAGVPWMIVNREAIDLNAMRRFELTGGPADPCTGDAECLKITLEPAADGSVRRVTTSFDYRASTGVVTRSYEFGEEGVLRAHSITPSFGSYERIELIRGAGPHGIRLTLLTEYGYTQGFAAEIVTGTAVIDLNASGEIVDHSRDFIHESADPKRGSQ